MSPESSSLKENYVLPGQRVYVDLFKVKQLGRATNLSIIVFGTLFVDRAIGFIHVEYLSSFTTSDILRAKINLIRSFGIVFPDYHFDNGVFNSQALSTHLHNGNQVLTLSGVGAEFQDGGAERNIGTIVSMVRTIRIREK